MEGAVRLNHGSLCGGIVCPVVVLIDISLHAGNRWHRGSKENVAVRCARRRFLTDEERVLSHVVRVGVDVDLPKPLCHRRMRKRSANSFDVEKHDYE